MSNQNNKLMRLPIIISRFSNLLFFVQKTNQGRLAGFDLQKHLADNIDLSFYRKTESEIWKQIRKSIGEQNTEQFKKVIIPIRPIFASHWKKASKNLLLWKQYFQNNQFLFQRTIFEVKKLSGIKHFAIAKIPIYFISNPISKNREIDAWFSWAPKKKIIVVEIPLGLEPPSSFFPISVLVHEFFHLILIKNKKLFSVITKITKENEKLFTKLSKRMPNRLFLEELLISSFVPEGYLSEKYLYTKVSSCIRKPTDLLTWREFVAYKLYQTAKKYTNENREIDEEYIKNLIELIKQNVK